MGEFRFKRFSVRNEASPLKVGTDAVLLGAAMTIDGEERRMLDIGTGTGVIALMAAQRSPAALIDAIEIDGAAAAEAGMNFAASPWESRLKAICSPFSRFSPEKSYDLIFSNPPYFDSSLKNPDGRTAAARHTESLSYREICAFAATNLSGKGKLSLILPAASEIELLRTAGSVGLKPFRLLRIRTTPSKPFSRIIAEFKAGRPCPPASQEELTLMDKSGGRSDAYSAITGDFYL